MIIKVFSKNALSLRIQSLDDIYIYLIMMLRMIDFVGSKQR